MKNPLETSKQTHPLGLMRGEIAPSREFLPALPKAKIWGENILKLKLAENRTQNGKFESKRLISDEKSMV